MLDPAASPMQDLWNNWENIKKYWELTLIDLYLLKIYSKSTHISMIQVNYLIEVTKNTVLFCHHSSFSITVIYCLCDIVINHSLFPFKTELWYFYIRSCAVFPLAAALWAHISMLIWLNYKSILLLLYLIISLFIWARLSYQTPKLISNFKSHPYLIVIYPYYYILKNLMLENK